MLPDPVSVFAACTATPHLGGLLCRGRGRPHHLVLVLLLHPYCQNLTNQAGKSLPAPDKVGTLFLITYCTAYDLRDDLKTQRFVSWGGVGRCFG